jgi:hypothetical protein
MSTMISEVYDALKEAGASEERSRARTTRHLLSALHTPYGKICNEISPWVETPATVTASLGEARGCRGAVFASRACCQGFSCGLDIFQNRITNAAMTVAPIPSAIQSVRFIWTPVFEQ